MTESPPEASARALQQFPHALRKLRVRDLELLCMLARTCSFARTAESGAMTQSALSKWLREIEHSLDVLLFARTTRRVAPTVFGKSFVECAERVLTDLAGVPPTIQALRSGLGQPVNVGFLHGGAGVLMPDVLARMERNGPPLRINLCDDTFDRLLPRLHWREIDLLVCRLDATALNSGFDAIPLYEDDVSVLGGPQHPLAREAKPSWADAACYPWIVAPKNSPMRNIIEATFAHYGIAMPRVIMESTSLMTNAATARMLPCLFLSLKLVAQRSPYSNALHNFGLRCHQFEQTVGVLHNPSPNTTTRSLIEIMQSVAHSISSPSSSA